MSRYQLFYCEENVWWLCQEPRFADAKSWVVFISNHARQCAVWQQRAADPGEPVVWDYHVVLLVEGMVWDLDTRLGFPVSLDDYLRASFRALPPELSHLTPRFRVVRRDEFVSTFATDRSHMRSDRGWRAPPPSWEPPGEGMNLMRFVDMDADFVGHVASLERLLASTGGDPPCDGRGDSL